MANSILRAGFVRLALVCAIVLVTSHSASAQRRGGKTYPGAEFDLSFRSFYQGEYRQAERDFQNASRRGIRGVNFLWVDSVCYNTMLGECYYHVGDLDRAIEFYDAAIRVYLDNPKWVTRLQFKNDNVQGGLPERITWGPKGRSSVPGKFPPTILSVQTNLNVVNVQQGGETGQAITQERTLYPLRVDEVMRCTALALARRAEILGPLVSRDPLSSQIERRIASHAVPANHWARPLFTVCSALAKVGIGQTDDAYASLQRSHSYGQLDHNLTALALLEMGKIKLAKGELDAAAKDLYESTFPAADFEQLDVLAEAMKHLAVVHRLRSPDQPLPVLDQVNAWARAKRYARVNASTSVAGADLSAYRQDTKNATQYLADAQRAMTRTDLMTGNLGARFQFAMATNGFLMNRDRQATAAFRAFMNLQAKSSLELYRVRWVFNQSKQGAIRESTASNLFRRVLQVPSSELWQVNPMGAVTMDETPHFDVLEHWMELELKRDQIERVVELADRIRAETFTSQSPLMARLMSLRWLLEAHDVLLDDDAKLQRQAILAAFPEWQELSKEVSSRQLELRKLPTLPTTPEHLEAWKQHAAAIRKASARQEGLLRKIALRPAPATTLFPRIRTLDQIQSGLAPGQAILDIISTARQTTFILLTNDSQYEVLGSKPTGREQRAIITMLKSFGNTDSKKPVSATQLAKGQWQKAAKSMYQSIFANRGEQTWSGINELIVVPDGQYWYVPFESLIFEEAGVDQPLISQCSIRYVPMASMAGNDVRRRSTSPSTFVVEGRIYRQSVTKLAKSITENDGKAAVAKQLIPVSSSDIGSQWDRLIVLNDIKRSSTDPFNWLPAIADGKVPQSKLADWMALPWDAPKLIVLPGFDTAASGSVGKKSTGEEMLQTTMGLLSTGCQTVLLSRWRLGGQASFDLVREFVTQLNDESPSSALQRSIELVRSSPIDPDAEPRIDSKSVTEENVPTGEHPFFWAGYQLIDLGQPVEPAGKP